MAKVFAGLKQDISNGLFYHIGLENGQQVQVPTQGTAKLQAEWSFNSVGGHTWVVQPDGSRLPVRSRQQCVAGKCPICAHSQLFRQEA